ncbi:hypothetical protein X975_06206, partial [Stegodyphus mimosarum]
MNTMDISQISELAAIMDTWAPASGSQIITNSQPLGVQSQESINKALVNAIKQEDISVSSEYNFPGVSLATTLQGYIPGHVVNPTSPEQVPMDDFDPLESFTFWDGENFYCHQDFEACAANACEMQTDSTMPPLPEYVGEDDITRDDVYQIKDPEFLHNPTLAELNSCGENLFDYSTEHNFLTEDNSFPLLADGLSKTFPPSDSHFIASPVNINIANHSSFVSGMNYAPSGFIDVKPNIQHSLSSSCPIPSRLLPNSQYFGSGEEKFLMCPQNSPASDSFYMQKLEPIQSKSQLSINSCSVTPPIHATPSRLQESNLLSSSAPPDVTMSSFFPKVKVEPPSHSPGPKSTERSLSGFSSLSLSNDDESGSFFDDDTDHDDEDDFSSDEDVYQYESDEVLSTSWPSSKEEKSCQHRKHRYFWQYNLQSRGAKMQNILVRK